MEEPKQEMSSLDFRFLAKELRAGLIGGLIRKVYQYGDSRSKQLLLEIFLPGKGTKLLYWDASKAFLTEKKQPVPVEPPNFCMFLRKHLLGRKVEDIRQHRFDRVLEIKTRDHTLILESIPPGNAILCDTSYKIIMPLEIQKWRGRVVRPKELYRFPQSGDDPFTLDSGSLARMLKLADKELGALLAVNLGFGSVYSREICTMAGLDSTMPSGQVALRGVIRLHNAIQSLGASEAGPVAYGGFVSPIPLQSLKEKPIKQGSFSQALDEFFSEQALKIQEEKQEEQAQERVEKVERVIEVQKQAEDKWDRIRNESSETAELIKRNYSLVESVLAGINQAKESGLSWEEIKQNVIGENTPEAQAIKEIREGDAIVVLDLGGREVELDFRLSVEDNIARYYEDAKWARKKHEGTSEAMESKQEELKQVQEAPKPEAPAPEPPIAQPDAPKPKKRRKKWFEKFHWFVSSDGFLVIGGKDVKQNEMIMSKYANPGDLIFHADTPGAAFVVIQSQDKPVSEDAKKEAAELAAANSKAWAQALGNADVFCAGPEQVSKSPPSGQYLPTGSFMFNGEKQWFREVELKLSIGIMIDQEKRESLVISGPVMPIRKQSNYFITIRPGYRKSLELAREIKKQLLIKASPEDKFLIDQTPLDEFQRLIPSGSGEIVEYGV